MTLLLLAAWLPAMLVTYLQNTRAPKQIRLDKKGRAALWEREQCVRASDQRTNVE